MTKLVVCVIRDVCGDLFAQPIFQPSIGSAQRAFMDAVNRQEPNNLLWQHPEHFELYQLGTYDDADASFDLFPKPKQLLLGSNCVVKAS